MENTFELKHRPLIWQVENVPESEEHVSADVPHKVRLCGTMMGHRVFRHRTFFCNYPAVAELPHLHEGKLVGSRERAFRTVGN